MRRATSEDVVQACARGLLARTEARMRDYERWAEAARVRAGVAARRLVRDHRVRRVWLFGSLAWGQPGAESDVDLLVEGLTVGDWSAALTTAEQEIAAVVDLVRVEDAAPGLIERVQRHGILLDESQAS